jgi:hypothetical protein
VVSTSGRRLPGQASQLLCTWNAFVLQTLGDQLVEADYQAMPSTAGYLPPVTAEQTAAFLGEVEYWSSRARRAAADPNFDIGADHPLPAVLPRWVEVEPCPTEHLVAMLAAARAVRDRVEAAQADFVRAGVAEDHAKDAAQLAGLVADADSAVSYAESLWSPTADGVLHERIEASLKRAIEGYYRVGQLFAIPTLLDRPDVQASTPVVARLPLPGQPGFDPWCLTSPISRARWQRDPKARRAIDLLWRYDPDPAATLGLQAQIDAAVSSGVVDSASSSLGDYFCCPWSAIYVARKPVVIGGRSLRPGDQLTLDVSAEKIASGGRFERQFVFGPFHPTDEIDYCDPPKVDTTTDLPVGRAVRALSTSDTAVTGHA